MSADPAPERAGGGPRPVVAAVRRFVRVFTPVLLLVTIGWVVVRSLTARISPLDAGLVLEAVTTGLFLAVLAGLFWALRVERR